MPPGAATARATMSLSTVHARPSTVWSAALPPSPYTHGVPVLVCGPAIPCLHYTPCSCDKLESVFVKVRKSDSVDESQRGRQRCQPLAWRGRKNEQGENRREYCSLPSQTSKQNIEPCLVCNTFLSNSNDVIKHTCHFHHSENPGPHMHPLTAPTALHSQQTGEKWNSLMAMWGTGGTLYAV